MLNGQFQPSLLAGRQVAEAQPRLIVDASPVDKAGAIGREHRAERASRCLGDRVLVTRDPISPNDLRQGESKVVVGVE